MAYQSRRGRIIELLNHGTSDRSILIALDKEFPPGTFRTTNDSALYGTKYDLGKTPVKKNKTKAPTQRARPNTQAHITRADLILSLQNFNAKQVIEQYRRKDLTGKAPDEILDFAVDNTIYRAFRYETPSIRYKNWRWHKTSRELVEMLNALRSQEEFDKLAISIGQSLVADWGKTNERGEPSRMNIGIAMKITNLVVKHLFFSGHVNNKHVLRWLHVPWDSFTLKPLRTIWQGSPPIPRTPSQGFVRNLAMYNQLYKLISEITFDANVPRIYYELFAWDQAH